MRPLSEVAELCLDAIQNDIFWATVWSQEQADKLRARTESQLEQTPPDYLLAPTLMARSAKERAEE